MANRPNVASFNVANVRGLGETMDALKNISPELFKEARAEMRDVVKPMLKTAKGLVPDERPLSRWREGSGAGGVGQVARSGNARMPNWNTMAAKRRIGFRITKKRPREARGRVILLRMIQNDPAGAVYDVAGAVGGGTFGANLNKKWGKTSRTMWPAADEHLSTVQDGIREAQSRMEDTINRQLRRR